MDILSDERKREITTEWVKSLPRNDGKYAYDLYLEEQVKAIKKWGDEKCLDRTHWSGASTYGTGKYARTKKLCHQCWEGLGE